MNFKALLFSLSLMGIGWGEEGISDKHIELAQVAPMKGSSAEFLGTQMYVGMNAALANTIIKGQDTKERTILIKAYNDNYEQEQTAKITSDIINKKGTFAFVGVVGTPTGKTLSIHAKMAKIPVVGLFTGAGFFRKNNDHIINLRASYSQEIQKMIDIVKSKNATDTDQVAVLMQEDAFGLAGLNAVQDVLKTDKKSPVAIGTFKRNSTSVDEGLSPICLKKPKVIIVVGPYVSVAAIIQKIRQDEKYKDIKDAIIMTLSFVGSDALLKKLNELKVDGTGVIVTQVVPNPQDTNKSIVQEFQRDVQSFCQNTKNADYCIASNPANWVSMEGYLVGKVIGLLLTKIATQGVFTREQFIKEAKNLDMDLGGFPLKFQNNQLSNLVIPTIIKNGILVPID